MSVSNVTDPGPANRPAVALVTPVLTPYRLHLTRRFVAEIPGVRFSSLFTHDQADQGWAKAHHPEIDPHYFGAGHPADEAGKLKWAAKDWSKGGEIIAWLKANNVKAAFVGGYSDPARLRVINWCRANNVPCFLVADSNARCDAARGVTRLIKNIVVPRIVKPLTGVMVFGTLGSQYFARYGATPRQTFISPCEPDYDLIRRVTPTEVAAACRRYGLDPSRKRIVTCGRLLGLKRIDLVIDAFHAIAAQRPDFELVIVGAGPMRAALEARVRPELRPRVIFTGFIGDQAEISAVYRASHVFVLASDYDAWGLVINEAMAAGMSVVCSDVVGASADLVREGVNGRTFPKGDLAALTAALLDATSPEKLDVYRAASHAVIEDWRTRADPVHGMRLALAAAGIPQPHAGAPAQPTPPDTARAVPAV